MEKKFCQYRAEDIIKALLEKKPVLYLRLSFISFCLYKHIAYIL